MQHPHPHAGYVPQPVLPSPVSRSSDVLALFVRLVCLSLSLSMHESALFIAERYACLCPNSEEAVFYHSLALLRSGQARMALETLRLATAVTTSTSDVVQASVGRRAQEQLKPAIEASLRCAWVYAEACIKLDRAQEGAEVLRKASKLHTGNSSSNNKSGKLSIPLACRHYRELAADEKIAIMQPSSIFRNKRLRRACPAPQPPSASRWLRWQQRQTSQTSLPSSTRRY